jgi:hypothetical protein
VLPRESLEDVLAADDEKCSFQSERLYPWPSHRTLVLWEARVMLVWGCVVIVVGGPWVGEMRAVCVGLFLFVCLNGRAKGSSDDVLRGIKAKIEVKSPDARWCGYMVGWCVSRGSS